MKSLWIKSLTVTAIASMSISAMAATTAAKKVSNTTSATITPAAVAKKPLPISVATDSYFYGTQLSDPTSMSTSDNAVDAKTGLSSDHFLVVGYKLNEKSKLSAVGSVTVQHTDPAGGGANRGTTFNNPYAMFSRSDLVKANIGGNDMSVSGQLRYYVPASEASRQIKNAGAFRLYLTPAMDLGKSGVNLSVTNYALYDIQTKDDAGLRQMKFYTGPQVTYTISPKVSAWALFEASVTIDQAGRSSLQNDQISHTDLEPGMSIELSKAITLSPYLNWYTNQRLETTSMNLNATIKLL